MSESVKVKNLHGEDKNDSSSTQTLQVIKFGGTSLKSIARIQHVA